MIHRNYGKTLTLFKGKLKGDGLCCYLAIESVDLALQILDGAKLKDLLPEVSEDRTLSVTKAKFELKGTGILGHPGP